jgi:hypothetical protein
MTKDVTETARNLRQRKGIGERSHEKVASQEVFLRRGHGVADLAQIR